MITADIIRKNPLRMMNGRKLCGSTGSNRRCISNDERGAGAMKRFINFMFGDWKGGYLLGLAVGLWMGWALHHH